MINTLPQGEKISGVCNELCTDLWFDGEFLDASPGYKGLPGSAHNAARLG